MIAAFKDEPYYLVGVLKKAVEIMETIAERKELSVADLVDILGQDRNAVNRIVLTMQHLGYLNRLENKKYTLSMKMFSFGSRALDQARISQTVQKYMKELSQSFGETVCLGQRHEYSIVTVDALSGTLPISFSARVGEMAPIQATSMGKCVLAAMPDEELKRLFGKIKFAKHTANTIMNQEDLWAEIRLIRQRGYAYDDEEWNDGVRCLGIPVYSPSGECSQGMSVSGPAISFTQSRIEVISRKLLEVKEALTREMGLANTLV